MEHTVVVLPFLPLLNFNNDVSYPCILIKNRFSIRNKPKAITLRQKIYLRPPCVADAGIIFLPCGFFFFYLSSFLSAYSPPSQIGCLPYFYTWCGASANLECRSEKCCMRLAANAGPKNRQLCPAMSSQLRHVSTIGKNLLNSNISPRRPPNMVNFGPLASVGHPSKFQRVSRLGSVTARHSSSGSEPNFAALNRGRHLYLAGRPSRWALAHIVVLNSLRQN